MQRTLLPVRLHCWQLWRMDPVHRFLRHWPPDSRALHAAASVRRQSVPAQCRDAHVHAWAMPCALHSFGFRRLDGVHQIVRHRCAVAVTYGR